MDDPPAGAQHEADPHTRWLELTFVAERALAERLAELLPEHGAAAVTLTDAGDDPVLEPWPGANPLWNATRVTALLDARESPDALRSRVRAALDPEPLPDCTVSALAERDWVRETQARFEAMRFGDRLCVCPSWREPPEGAEVVVHLDPGVAFGTGTHESTALCLEWLDGARVEGASVIDYGCGSGILALAALALGAARVQALDIDPQACAASAENAARNGLGARLSVHGPGEALEAADIVLANILAGPLIDLAPTLGALLRPGGQIVLAGITVEQVDAVCAAYGQPGEGGCLIAWDPPRLHGDWALAVGEARARRAS